MCWARLRIIVDLDYSWKIALKYGSQDFMNSDGGYRCSLNPDRIYLNNFGNSDPVSKISSNWSETFFLFLVRDSLTTQPTGRSNFCPGLTMRRSEHGLLDRTVRKSLFLIHKRKSVNPTAKCRQLLGSDLTAAWIQIEFHFAPFW